MKSLQARLLTVLLLTILSFWAAWTTWEGVQVTWQSAPAWDAELAAVAQEILVSLPANMEQFEPRGRLTVSSNHAIATDPLSYQIWAPRSRKSLMRSATAPQTPLRADFKDGSALVRVAGESWRVFAISDATAHIQVQAGVPARMIRRELAVTSRQNLAVASVMFLLLSCAIWLVIRWSLRPVAVVRRLIGSRHPLDLAPLPLTNLPRELQPLLTSFNSLLAQLDAAMQAERRFIADAAHELRAPLAAMMAHAQLAACASDLESSKATLAKLVRGAERSARLSEQLLDSARLDVSRVVSEAQRVAMHELVSVVVHDFEQTAGQHKQAITLLTQPAEIRGDLDDMGILVRNLIDNACRYSGEGARIDVACVQSAREGTRGVRVTVADDGPGVAKEEHERIFDRFYRVPGTPGRGSGVGLSLVAHIARLHGGAVEAGIGLAGRGLAVSVWLPAAGQVR
jgi:two-component system sensor histidine kinase QseC